MLPMIFGGAPILKCLVFKKKIFQEFIEIFFFNIF